MNSTNSVQSLKIASSETGYVPFIKNTGSSLSRLSGFSDLTESVRAYRQREFLNGTRSLVYGIAKLAVTGACVYTVYFLTKNAYQQRETNNQFQMQKIQLENQEKTINELNKKIIEFQKNDENQAKQLKDQSDAILNNQETIFSNQETISKNQETIGKLKENILGFKKIANDKDKQLKERENLIQSHQNTMHFLNEKIDQLDLQHKKCEIEKLNQRGFIDNLIKPHEFNPKNMEKLQSSTRASNWFVLELKKGTYMWPNIPLNPVLDIDSVEIYRQEVDKLNPHVYSDARDIICNSAFTNLKCGSAGVPAMCLAIKNRFDPKFHANLEDGRLYTQLLSQKIKPACATLAHGQRSYHQEFKD